MKAATRRQPGIRTRRLLVVDGRDISHRQQADLPSLLAPGDLVVANDAATLPASLTGLLAATGAAIEVRLAGRPPAHDSLTWIAVVFGAGDYRVPTEERGRPPRLFVGDQLLLGPLRARVQRLLDHPRLIELRFDGRPGAMWEGLARHGRPIQYSYVPQRLAIWDSWTSIAGPPVAYEAPSAGFVLDWATLHAIRRRGAQFATITHAAGISSTGDPVLDARLPLDEAYDIPHATAGLLAATHTAGGRIVAIGTTVVRALESAATDDGTVRPGAGIATAIIGRDSRLRVVDALVSGMHEPGTSHYELLKAFVDESLLQRAVAEADARGYEAHEFGDAAFIVRPRERYPMRTLRGNCELSSRNVFLRASSATVG